MAKGVLYVVSGPSASGKGTICHGVMGRAAASNTPLWLSVSATTRPPRVEEVDGVHYFFKTKNEFADMVARNDVLEHTFYNDHYYGTPVQYFNEKTSQGVDVILEIETDGAAQVKHRYPDAVLVFVMAPSLLVLEQRLRDRIVKGKPFGVFTPEEQEKTEEMIHWRMSKAREELQLISQYDYLVVNDRLDTAVDDLLAIIRSQRCRIGSDTPRLFE